MEDVMKQTKNITVAVALLAATLVPLAAGCAQQRIVSVRGIGNVAVEADRALIQLSVVTSAKEAGVAAAQNAETMTRVQEAIQSAVALHREEQEAEARSGQSGSIRISTANYSIYQESSYSNGIHIPGDYRVSNDIKVYLLDKELASTIIDAAIQAGANSLSSLTFSVSDPEDAIRRARTKAVQNARSAAQLIADTAGARLGRMLEVTELNDGATRTSYKTAAVYNDLFADGAIDVGGTADTPVAGGKIDYTVTVDATFELK